MSLSWAKAPLYSNMKGDTTGSVSRSLYSTKFGVSTFRTISFSPQVPNTGGPALKEVSVRLMSTVSLYAGIQLVRFSSLFQR